MITITSTEVHTIMHGYRTMYHMLQEINKTEHPDTRAWSLAELALESIDPPDVIAGICKKCEIFRAALEEIRAQHGKVCGQFEDCEHAACNSSYAAWNIADRVLRGEWEATE